MNFIIDGAGGTIASGIKGWMMFPFNCTLTSVTLLADQVGSIVVDLKKVNYTNYDGSAGTSIVSATPPSISSGVKTQDTSLTNWTTQITDGDIIGISVTSAATVTRVVLVLRATKP
jgi:hypothetical protein